MAASRRSEFTAPVPSSVVLQDEEALAQLTFTNDILSRLEARFRELNTAVQQERNQADTSGSVSRADQLPNYRPPCNLLMKLNPVLRQAKFQRQQGPKTEKLVFTKKKSAPPPVRAAASLNNSSPIETPAAAADNRISASETESTESRPRQTPSDQASTSDSPTTLSRTSSNLHTDSMSITATTAPTMPTQQTTLQPVQLRERAARVQPVESPSQASTRVKSPVPACTSCRVFRFKCERSSETEVCAKCQETGTECRNQTFPPRSRPVVKKAGTIASPVATRFVPPPTEEDHEEEEEEGVEEETVSRTSRPATASKAANSPAKPSQQRCGRIEEDEEHDSDATDDEDAQSEATSGSRPSSTPSRQPVHLLLCSPYRPNGMDEDQEEESPMPRARATSATSKAAKPVRDDASIFSRDDTDDLEPPTPRIKRLSSSASSMEPPNKRQRVATRPAHERATGLARRPSFALRVKFLKPEVMEPMEDDVKLFLSIIPGHDPSEAYDLAERLQAKGIKARVPDPSVVQPRSKATHLVVPSSRTTSGYITSGLLMGMWKVPYAWAERLLKNRTGQESSRRDDESVPYEEGFVGAYRSPYALFRNQYCMNMLEDSTTEEGNRKIMVDAVLEGTGAIHTDGMAEAKIIFVGSDELPQNAPEPSTYWIWEDYVNLFQNVP